MSEEEVIEIGTEVFIFNYISGRKEQDKEHFKKGTIIKAEKSPDISLYGPPRFVMNYLVLGEDGNYYSGNMGQHTVGNHYFMTGELYKNYIKSKIHANEEKIKILEIENEKLQNTLDSIINKPSEYRK